jgi:uncharacterized protein DUF4229
VLPVVTYFLARLVLFVLSVVVLGLLGAGPVLALFGGLLISVLLSYLLLRRLREPATAVVAQRLQARQVRRTGHPDEDELFEDAAVDAQTRSRAETAPDAEGHGEVAERERTDRSFPSQTLRDGERHG